MNPELKDPKHPFLGPNVFIFFRGGEKEGPWAPKNFNILNVFENPNF